MTLPPPVFLLCALMLCGPGASVAATAAEVGSKQFTEGIILGEIAVQLLRAQGTTARHQRGLGGTRVLWNALLAGEIDIYPEYTGTLLHEMFSGEGIRTDAQLDEALARLSLRSTGPLGFNNTYVLGMREDRAEALQISAISHLVAHPELRLGFSNEFMDRDDGWPGLRRHYGLPHERVRGLDHSLAYRAVADGSLDVTDLYATDAEIRHYRIRPLADDQGYFPDYRALLLYRADFEAAHPEAIRTLRRLQGRINDARMMEMNAAVKMTGRPEAEVASAFVAAEFGLGGTGQIEDRQRRFLRNTRDHLILVGISLSAAILVAVPLGIFAARRPVPGGFILGAAGVVQTIPSLALLVFMIPFLGIGGPPAVAALFLYSLLPIIRNTCSGLRDIPAPVRESAVALGLPPSARLRLVELPLATRSILAGIKTSAVINVGTATLGALIGAGGYGQPILTGIRLDDLGLILEGAVPAALLALLVQGSFDLAERYLLPAGLRYRNVD